MTRLIFAVCSAVAVGGMAGLVWFARWLRDGAVIVPDYVPDYLVAAVEGE